MKLLLFILFTLTLAQAEEVRLWRNADASKSFKGSFVRAEGNFVFIDKDGTILKVDGKNLHKEDIVWVTEQIRGGSGGKAGGKGVFGSINFGDTRNQVMDKLKDSAFLSRSRKDAEVFSTDNVFSGLYKTKEDLGGLTFRFYCSWDEEEKISMIELKSDAISAYDSLDDLNEAWLEMVELLKQIYGDPIKENPSLPSYDQVKQSIIIGTHKWKTEGADIILGPALERETEKVFLIVRITG